MATAISVSPGMVLGKADPKSGEVRLSREGFLVFQQLVQAVNDATSDYILATATQTLTNKTLTAPIINGGTITGITDLAIADGGSGASTAAGARTNFGLAIGTDVQAYAATLASWAAITRGAGFDTFAATAYTEAAWTPVDSSGAALSLTSVTARYTRIGRLVFATGTFTYPATADVSAATIGGLPLTVVNADGAASGAVVFSTVGSVAGYFVPLKNTTTAKFYTPAGAATTNLQLSGTTLIVNAIYSV